MGFFFFILSLSTFCIRADPISPVHCHKLLTVNKTWSQENVKYNEKESGKVIKQRKLATSFPMGHILTGSASSSVSSTKKHATTSAASAAAISALVCVTRVLSIKRTPPKALHNVNAGRQGGKTVLFLKNTKNEPLGVYPFSFFTMKQIVKEIDYNDVDEERIKYSLL